MDKEILIKFAINKHGLTHDEAVKAVDEFFKYLNKKKPSN